MKNPLSIVLSGLNGYGYHYRKALQEDFPAACLKLVGAVDPFAKDADLTVFPSLVAFYEAGLQADLAVIASPIQYHVDQSLTAMAFGSHVLCDKPLGANVEECRDLIQARDASQRWLMIGYQWSFSEAIQELKSDLLQGVYGKPIRTKALCCWPRDKTYYARNAWAGRIKDAQGRWVLDSPANNAMAHFLHNLFYLMGEEVHLSALPREVTAETYRAYPVETFDTVACRSRTVAGVEVLFYASHTTQEEHAPIFHLEFERGSVAFDREIVGCTADGEEKNYGSPEDTPQFQKLHYAVKALQKPQPMLCGPEAALAQTLCVQGIQETETAAFPEALIRSNPEASRIWVEGLDEHLRDCYQAGRLPSEQGLAWARSGRTVDLTKHLQ